MNMNPPPADPGAMLSWLIYVIIIIFVLMVLLRVLGVTAWPAF